MCKFRSNATSHSFFNYFLLVFQISIVQWLNCRNLKDELNRSYNGGGVVYIRKSEASRSTLQYPFIWVSICTYDVYGTAKLPILDEIGVCAQGSTSKILNYPQLKDTQIHNICRNDAERPWTYNQRPWSALFGGTTQQRDGLQITHSHQDTLPHQRTTYAPRSPPRTKIPCRTILTHRGNPKNKSSYNSTSSKRREEDAQVKRSMHVVGDGHPNRHTGGNQKDVL